MAVITPSTLTKTVITMYEAAYREAQDLIRTYDQFAGVMKETLETKGNSVTVSFHSDMLPSMSTGSRTADPTPQSVLEASTSVTTGFYQQAVQAHETDFQESFAFGIKTLGRLAGQNKMESIDALARHQAVTGNWVIYPGSHTSRSTLDTTVTTDYVTDAAFLKIKEFANNWYANKFIDNTIFCVMDDFAYGDLASGGNVVTRAQYTEQGAQILLNYEVGQVYGVRIVRSPLSKRFFGTGAANASAATPTVGVAVNALDTTCGVSVSTNIAAGNWLTVGSAETSTTEYLTTEIVYVPAAPSGNTTVTIIGGGVNGGFRFPHAVGETITNACTVHATIFGGPNSLAKVFSPLYGEYGELINPKNTGLLDQFVTAGWKYWGGYGIINQAWLIRLEAAAKSQ